MRQKKCKSCGKPFTPTKPLQQVCDFACAIEFNLINKAKVLRKELKIAKDKIKSRQEWLKEAQTAFNNFIRARDKDLPCISCGRHHQGQYHAGHYLTVGARPELRFNEMNCAKQCQPCNTHLHGNLILYRVELIKRIGLYNVEWLEGHHEPSKHTISDLKVIKALYKAKLKELK